MPPKMLSSSTSCLVGAELAGCHSQQGKQTLGKGWMPKCNPNGPRGSHVCRCLPFLHLQEDTGPATWV